MLKLRLIAAALAAALAAAAVPSGADAQSISQKNKICADLKAERQIEVCTDLINRGGKDIDIYYYNRSDGWQRKGECDLAQADAEQAMSLKRDVDHVLRLGLVWLECKKDVDRAIGYFDDAIRQYPRSVLAYYNRANSYFAKNDYEKALSDINHVIRNDQKDPDFFYLRARIWMDTENYDRAITDFSQVLRMKPQYADTYSYRGLTYSRQNEQAKA